MNYEVVFESDRIIFIKLTKDLVEDYVNMVNDENVQRLISKKRNIYKIDEELEWINGKLKNNSIIFSMIEKVTNNYIGNIEIMNINNNIGELGIAITPNQQDKHFGQEAIKRLIKYCFDDLKLDGLELNVFSFNPRAIHCYEKVGFVKDGVGKEPEDIHMVIRK